MVKALDWLNYTGSLTEAMEAYSRQKMSVTVLRQGVGPLYRDEQVELAQPMRTWGWLREVELSFGGVPWVMARTVVPTNSTSKQLGRLKLLRQKPLGPMLFNQFAAERSAIDFQQLDNVKWLKKTFDHSLWCRRSLFNIGNDFLMLKEVFMPQHPIYHDHA